MIHSFRRSIDTVTMLCEADLSSSTFRQWFNGSKVVDAEGRPLRVFHGTNKTFDLPFKEFTYFGSADAANDRIKNQSVNTRLYPVFLNIGHPYSFKDTGMDGNYDVLMSMYQDQIVNEPPNGVEPEFENEIEMNNHTVQESKFIIDALSRHDYDGLMFVNISEDVGSISWVPFSNDQIWFEFA